MTGCVILGVKPTTVEVMAQKRKEFHSFNTVGRFLSEPDNRLVRFLKHLPHLWDLAALLVVVDLINADRIYPPPLVLSLLEYGVQKRG